MAQLAVGRVAAKVASFVTTQPDDVSCKHGSLTGGVTVVNRWNVVNRRITLSVHVMLNAPRAARFNL